MVLIEDQVRPVARPLLATFNVVTPSGSYKPGATPEPARGGPSVGSPALVVVAPSSRIVPDGSTFPAETSASAASMGALPAEADSRLTYCERVATAFVAEAEQLASRSPS